MNALGRLEAARAEVNHYRDRLALLRVRLYRQGVVTNERLEDLQRRLDSAQTRLRAARAAARPEPRR